ncbi:MAG: hypothetical protein ACI4RA_06665 [Kiritimatiellia bacterium]
MSLSKQQMLAAVGAGAFVLCAGGLGFMLYLAWAEKGEAEESLQGQTDAFRHFNEAAVFPSKASIASVKSNGTSYAAWYDSAVALAARGDRTLPSETPPIFKQRLQAEVRRMLVLAGGADGKIAAPTFLFGFEQYLGEGGVLPKDGDVPRLAIQLDTISRVVDIFAEAGILELKAIQRMEDRTAEVEGSNESPRGRKQEKDSEADAPKETCLKYAFEFLTRPAALVTTLNRLTACERFVTVKNLSFKETADVIMERLSAIENAETQRTSGRAATGRRGRRGAATAVDAATGAVKVDPLVVDPELDAPIQVNFILEVRDFGRVAKTEAVAETSDAAKPEAEKPAEQKENGK